MATYSIYFPHIVWFAVARKALEDHGEASPYHKSNGEYAILIEGGVELHVVELQHDYHVYLSVASVGGEGSDAQLDHPHRGD
jgi:hypothetical protein